MSEKKLPKEVIQTIPALPIPAPPLPPKTTEQEDMTLAGQRSVNLIWEWSQAIIAIIVVLGNMIVAVYHGLGSVKVEFPQILSNSLFLVVGFYFSRTNHQAIGGVGRKANESQDYQGR